MNRVQRFGAYGLEDQSRAPKHIPHRTPAELVKLILTERREHPTWGPKKLKDVLERRLGHALPAPSTIGSMLDRSGLVDKRRYRRRHKPRPTTLRQALAPNDVWCIDYKGHFASATEATATR